MSLKHFIKDKYNSIGEALLDIRKELQRLQPVDSGSIAWEQTETGMSAHIGDGSMGGSMPTEASSDESVSAASSSVSPAYNGYFKLVDMTKYNEDTGEPIPSFRFGIVDGNTFDGSTSEASVASINSKGYTLQPFTYPKATEGGDTAQILKKNTYYYVSLEYVYVTDKVTYRISEGVTPTSDDSVLHTVIGCVRVVDNSIRIDQMHTGGIIHMKNEYTGPFKLVRIPVTQDSDTKEAKETCKLLGGYVDALRSSIPDTDITETGSVYVNIIYNIDNKEYSYTVASSAKKASDSENVASIYIGSYDGTRCRQSHKAAIYLAGDYII